MLEKLKRIDWSIVVLLLILMVISTMLVYSATLNSQIKIPIEKSLLNYALGFLAFAGVMLIDYRIYAKIHWYLYGFGLVLLVAVLQFGKSLNNARGWFELPGGFNFQPAELVKLLIIITLAAFMARREGEKLGFVRDVIPASLLVFAPFTLVMIQPDLGNAVIYLVIFAAMLWIGNIKYSHAFIGLAAIVGGLMLFVYLFGHFHDEIYNYLDARDKSHWVDRIDTFLNPESVDRDKKWQLDHSMTAIGSGGLFGEGYLKGSSVHNNFVPLTYSDSIFVVVGEEFGFVGSSVLLLLYFLLIYRLILISIQAQKPEGSYMIVGIVTMFVFQIFENIGMLIGIMPLTGITLPFISYGGSSLMINMIGAGIAMSVRIHRDEPAKY
mgnify:CR=1 FL=1|jgi:rod shape determining protein RodA